jgi:hypothetical protein
MLYKRSATGPVPVRTLLSKPLDFWLEWTATIVLIVSVALTSFNIYPANVFVGLLGNLGWLAVAMVWRKWSLLVVQVVITLLYLSGVATYLLS